MLRRLVLVLFCSLSWPLLAAEPLLASWTFESDTNEVVKDTSPNASRFKHTGQAFAAPMTKRGRHFYQSNSLLDFGLTTDSTFDLQGLEDFVLYARLESQKAVGIASLFNNGQLQVGLLDNHLYATLKTFYGQVGLVAPAALIVGHRYALQVTFDHGMLSLVIDGRVAASIHVGSSAIESGPVIASVQVGGGFIGYLSGMSFSSYSRYDVTPPHIIIASNLSELEIELFDFGSGVDETKSEVYVNGELVEEIEVGANLIRADITPYLYSGENDITVIVQDLSGNVGRFEDVIHFEENKKEQKKTTPEFISVGGVGYCTLDSDGLVRCEGKVLETSPGQPLYEVVSLDMGVEHGCALDANADVYCWGEDWGEYAVRVLGLSDRVVSMKAKQDRTCMVLANREAYCVKENALTAYIPEQDLELKEVKRALRGIQGIKKAHHFGEKICVLSEEDDLYCSAEKQAPFVKMNGVLGVVSADVGPKRVCMILENDEVKCLDL